MSSQMPGGYSIWQSVIALRKRFQDSVPDGVTVVVDLEMIDGTVLRPIVLQEREAPWIVIEVAESQHDEATRQIVFLRGDHIARVRISREPADKYPLGFTVGDVGIG